MRKPKKTDQRFYQRLMMIKSRQPESSPRLLEILISGRLAGTLRLIGDDKSLFLFDASYVDDPGSPVLSLSFKSAGGGLLTEFRPTRMKVHPFFSNLLPEGHLRDYLSTRLGINREREFYLLAALGEDLPGGVVARPFEEKSVLPFASSSEEEDEQSKRKLLKFSLAGIQLKFSAIREAAGGLTLPASGIGGQYIVKLPSSRYQHVPEAELASLELARLVGIETAEAHLVETADIRNLPEDIPERMGQSLAVKRFDRAANKRIHIEDFAQVFGQFPDNKYSGAAFHDIARVVWQTSGEAGLVEFVRRLVFMVAIGNGDMHLKNWSLIYRDGVTPELSPAYDLLPTIAFAADRTLALSLGKAKLLTEVTQDNFARFSAKAGVPSRLVQKVVQDTVETFHDAWVKKREMFPNSIREALESHIAQAELLKSKPS